MQQITLCEDFFADLPVRQCILIILTLENIDNICNMLLMKLSIKTFITATTSQKRNIIMNF